MAGKKTNFITYELKKLNKYYKQLEGYLDDNPPDQMVDRVEHLTSIRGNPIIRVIASKEDQLKTFLTALEKLPKILEDINRLRKAVDGKEEVNVRGNQSLPGFMQGKEDDDELEFEEVKNNKDIQFEDDDDDDKGDSKSVAPKELPPATDDDKDNDEDVWTFDEDLEDD